MLKLGDALRGWRPSERGTPISALAALQGGWAELAGEDVAKNSAPSRIAGDTLVVVTRSAAWSHQLSLLSEPLLAAIGVKLGDGSVRRLRFRVGTLPQPGHVRRAPAERPPVPSAPAEIGESGSPNGALERFRRSVEGSQRTHLASGWSACAACGGMTPPDRPTLCITCESSLGQERAAATARLLFEAPWLGYAGTAELVSGLDKREYERIRSTMLRRWWTMLERARAAGCVSRNGHERLVASSYVVLRSRLSPEAILPQTVRSILGDELHDVLYGSETGTTHNNLRRI